MAQEINVAVGIAALLCTLTFGELYSTTPEEVVLQNKSFVEQPELRSDDGADDGDIMVHGRVLAGDPKG